MVREEILIIWGVCLAIVFLLFLVATLFCGVALYYRFDNGDDSKVRRSQS